MEFGAAGDTADCLSLQFEAVFYFFCLDCVSTTCDENWFFPKVATQYLEDSWFQKDGATCHIAN